MRYTEPITGRLRAPASSTHTLDQPKEIIMDPVAAKYIGAGLACLGMAGAGIGLGNLFGQFLSGALRNPSAADGQRGTLLLGFALTEALGIFSLLVALLLLFVV
jgi:F-type H+-transporting ATPase subunit c